MKRSFLLLLMLFAISDVTNAQSARTFTIQPGENIPQVIPMGDRMAFPQFRRGTIFFTNGNRSGANLNVSWLTNEMLFINATGDTLALSNPKEVKLVTVGNDQLFYAAGRFVKKDTTVGDYMLATTYSFSTADRRKVGAFGTTTDGATDSYIALDAASIGRTDMTPQVLTVLSRKEFIFIGNDELKFVPAGKKQLVSLFPRRQADINRYLQEKQVDFSSRSDLVQLLSYLQQR